MFCLAKRTYLVILREEEKTRKKKKEGWKGEGEKKRPLYKQTMRNNVSSVFQKRITKQIKTKMRERERERENDNLACKRLGVTLQELFIFSLIPTFQ